jgi:hypothetical protein
MTRSGPSCLLLPLAVLSGCGTIDDSAPTTTDAGAIFAQGRDAHGAPPEGGFAAFADAGSCATLPDDDLSLIDYLAGPAATTAPTATTVYDRGVGGRYCYWWCDDPAVDWAGFGGQALLLPASGGPSMSRLRFTWSKHTGHGGANFAHLYLLAPIAGQVPGDSDSWFTSPRDPALDAPAWRADDPELRPIAIGRGRVTWSNNGVIAFRGGLVGAAGSGNNNDNFAFAKLDAGKVPSAVAVTNNSELALVTVWDTAACSAELAVFALTQRDGYVAALPSEGFFSSIKLLGYVPLPIKRPTRVSASVDFSFWMGFTSKDSVAELSTQAGRDKWAANIDDAHSAARSGYALVASRDEGKVVVVDLSQLLTYLRKMYMTTPELFAETQASTWPNTFDVAPESMPTVGAVLDVDAPAAVATGFPVGDRSYSDADFAKKAYVATVAGPISVYDMSGASPALLRTIDGCKNPTSVAYGRGGATRDGLVFACRGDRTVLFVGKGGDDVRVLSDARLYDPVSVVLGDSRGASVVSVGDYTDRQVLSYLTGPIDSWGDELFGGLGADGKAAFELTGIWLTEGRPFALSSAMIP